MNRGLLALGLGLVAAAGIALYVATRGNDRTADGDAASAPRNAEPPPPGGAPLTPSAPAERAGRAAPLPPSAPAAPAGTDYVVGDVRVRDHRTGTHEQLDVAPVIHAPTGTKIASALSSEIAKNIGGVVAECAGLVPSAAIRLRDVTGESSAAAQQCLEQKVIGVSTPSGNEPDIDGYGITLSLRLP